MNVSPPAEPVGCSANATRDGCRPSTAWPALPAPREGRAAMSGASPHGLPTAGEGRPGVPDCGLSEGWRWRG